MGLLDRLFNSNKSDEYLIDVYNNTMDEQNGLISQVHRDPANKGVRSRIEEVGDKQVVNRLKVRTQILG